MAKKTSSALRRNASEIKHYRVLIRLIPPILGVIALSLIIVYVASVLYARYGAFTVTIQQDDSYALTLYERADVCTADTENKQGTSHINMNIAANITNISGDDIPDYVDNVDGEHNGDNYAAYTFYCKNAGSAAITYKYQLYIGNVTQDLDKAVRIKLYVNGEATTYAFTALDGSGAEEGTVAFLTEDLVVEGEISGFAPQDYTKFTVVVWLEGDDAECVDDKIGGTLKVSMKMQVIG